MQNAKEKANELVEKYLNIVIHFPYIDTEDGNCIGTGHMTYYSAVNCAIKAVEEILRALYPNYVDWDDCGAAHQYWYETQKEEALEFWNNVKSELQSLCGGI